MCRLAADEKARRARLPVGAETVPYQSVPQGAGAAVGGGEQRHVPQVIPNGVFDDAVVRAAEQHRVQGLPTQGGEGALHGVCQHRVRAVDMPMLDHGGKLRAGQTDDLTPRAARAQRLGELAAGNAGGGGDHGQGLFPRQGGHGLHRGVKHAAGGDGVGLQHRVGGGGDGAAGGEDGLDAEGREKVHVLPGDAAELFLRPGPVGHTARVGKEHEILLRQQTPQRLEPGESADAGVVDSDGSVVHVRSCSRKVSAKRVPA